MASLGLSGHEQALRNQIIPPSSLAAAVSLPPVLVPSLDLCVGEVEGGRQLHAVLDAQVLLPLEAALQLRQLVVRKGRPGLPGLLQPNLRAVSTAGDLPVPLLFHWRIETAPIKKKRRRREEGENRAMASHCIKPHPSLCARATSIHGGANKSVQQHCIRQTNSLSV